GEQGRHRRLGDPRQARLRRRLLRGGDLAARGDERGREDQRAALSVLQGHHGREEKAGADDVPGRRGHRPGPGRAGRRGHRGGRSHPAAAAPGRHGRQGRRGRRRQGGRVPRRAEVHLSQEGNRATVVEILVLAEHVGDDVKKVTLELITLARRFGEPSVVWTGPGADGGQARCAEYGAAGMYVADGTEFDEYVTAPAVELLAQLVGEKSPALVLVAGTAQGKEVAGRLAVKID